MAGQVDPAQVRDRIVLIGTVAPSLKDMLYTPYSDDVETFNAPGVIIHAQIVSHLLDVATGQRPAFSFWPRWGEVLWLAGWALVGVVLAWRLGPSSGLGAGSLLALGMIYAVGWGLFLDRHLDSGCRALLVGFARAMAVAMAHRLFYTHTRDPLTGRSTAYLA